MPAPPPLASSRPLRPMLSSRAASPSKRGTDVHWPPCALDMIRAAGTRPSHVLWRIQRRLDGVHPTRTRIGPSSTPAMDPLTAATASEAEENALKNASPSCSTSYAARRAHASRTTRRCSTSAQRPRLPPQLLQQPGRPLNIRQHQRHRPRRLRNPAHARIFLSHTQPRQAPEPSRGGRCPRGRGRGGRRSSGAVDQRGRADEVAHPRLSETIASSVVGDASRLARTGDCAHSGLQPPSPGRGQTGTRQAHASAFGLGAGARSGSLAAPSARVITR